MKSMNKIEKIENIIFVILCCFQFLLAFTIFVAVVARYVFKFPIPEVIILQNFSLVWLVMIGAGIAIKNKDHLDIDIFGPYMSDRGNAIRIFIIDLLVMISVVFLIFVGYKIFLAGFVRKENTPIRFLEHRITMVYFNSSFIVGSIIMAYYQSINLLKSFRKLKNFSNIGNV